MIIGIILAVLYLILVGKVILKKVKHPGFQKFYMNLHKLIGFLLPLIAMLHLILAWKLFKQRPIGMYVTGIVMVLFTLMEVISYLNRNKLEKRWIKVHRIAAVGILICFVVHVTFGFVSLSQYKEAMKAIQLEDVRISEIVDGDYIGEYDAGYVYARVQVSVEDGVIQSVDLLEHRTERGQSAEIIPEQIVDQQKVTVDAVSGATNSSRVIEKAVYNALMQKQQR